MRVVRLFVHLYVQFWWSDILKKQLMDSCQTWVILLILHS